MHHIPNSCHDQRSFQRWLLLWTAAAACHGCLCKETQLLAVLLSETDQPLHLLVVCAYLLAKVLDNCGHRSSSGSSSGGSNSGRNVSAMHYHLDEAMHSDSC